MISLMTHSSNQFRSAIRLMIRATGLSLLLMSLALPSLAQSNDPPVQSVPSSSPPQPSGDPQKDSAPTPKPAGPAKPKKVITNDDLEPRSAPSSSTPSSSFPNAGSLLNCDAYCEQQAREELGYDSDREAEWQMQIVNARRDLAKDTLWHQLLSQALQQSNSYCNFLAQRSQKVSPSNNSFGARILRDQTEQYFQNMDHTLQQNLQSLASRMSSYTNEVGELAPVRGAMMYVQGARILQRVCQFPLPR